jgi:hypothetical protein
MISTTNLLENELLEHCRVGELRVPIVQQLVQQLIHQHKVALDHLLAEGAVAIAAHNLHHLCTVRAEGGQELRRSQSARARLREQG